MRFTKLSILGLLASCALESTEVDEVDEVDEVEQPSSCPIWQCGSNSPVIDGHGFHDIPEALLSLVRNSGGLRIAAFMQNMPAGLTYFQPDVTGGKLRGLDAGGNVVLSAALGNLNGARLLLDHSSGAQYLVKIEAIDSNLAYWARKSSVRVQPKLESYLLTWAITTDGITPMSGFRNVCSNAQPTLTDPDNLGMNGEHTLLFEGDRINSASKTFGSVVDVHWFNFGCAGHALAKLALTGHTEGAAQAGAFSTTIAERQTMLKMFVADYCRDGYPFTVPGQPLRWKDDHGSMTYAMFVSPPVAIEGRWNASGAVCIDTPRVDANNAVGNAQFGISVWDEVDAHCPGARPPRCSVAGDPASADPNNLAGNHIVTGNP